MLVVVGRITSFWLVLVHFESLRVQGLHIKYVGEGPEGFCGGHDFFQAYIDRPLNIFQNFRWATKYFLKFYFHNFIV